MRKLVGLAAAGLLAVSTANAGNIKVANTDMVLYGGVSTGWNYQTADHVLDGGGFDKDGFSINTFAIGLMKAATEDSPLGFNAALASFDVPTLIASSKFINNHSLIGHGTTADSFKVWLAYASWMITKGVVIDAGLLWDQFGERPLTVLNPNITRGILFTGHPVLFAGARATIDAGAAKVYVGFNNGGGLRQGGPVDLDGNGVKDVKLSVNDAIEAGVMGQAGDIKFGIHTYNEAKGRDIYALCLKGTVGNTAVGIEIDYTTLDDSVENMFGAGGADTSAWGIALNANPNMGEVALPIRIEYVDNGDSAPGDNHGSGVYLIGGGTSWSFTITPTYKPSANTLIRAEFAYIKTDENFFAKKDGTATDSRSVVSVEFGFLF